MSFDTIAVLGLGIIGSRVASHLGKAAQVKTWNRTPKGLPDEASSVEDAIADADLVCLYLKDAPATREVAARIFAAPSRERVLVNHATIDLPTTRWLAEECAARGIGFLDCPFTGSREAAAAGALVYYAGGPEDLIDRVEPILLRSGKSVLRCGATGTATIMKLVTNLISACTVQALAESLATATRHGISPEALTHAVSLNACGEMPWLVAVARDSASACTVQAEIKLVTSFMMVAVPVAPQRSTDLPERRSTGSTRSISSSGPPA